MAQLFGHEKLEVYQKNRSYAHISFKGGQR